MVLDIVKTIKDIFLYFGEKISPNHPKIGGLIIIIAMITIYLIYKKFKKK